MPWMFTLPIRESSLRPVRRPLAIILFWSGGFLALERHDLLSNFEEFTRGENSNLPNLKTTELERAVYGALELHYRMSNLFEESSNDSIAPLFDANLHPRRSIVRSNHRRLCLYESIRQSNAAFKLVEQRLGYTTLNSSFIRSLKSETGMHQLFSHLAVVRKDHESRGVKIKSPDREVGCVVLRQKLRYRSTAFRVMQR